MSLFLCCSQYTDPCLSLYRAYQPSIPFQNAQFKYVETLQPGTCHLSDFWATWEQWRGAQTWHWHTDMLANICPLYIQQTLCNIRIHLELCLCPHNKCESNIHSSFNYVYCASSQGICLWVVSSPTKSDFPSSDSFIWIFIGAWKGNVIHLLLAQDKSK